MNAHLSFEFFCIFFDAAFVGMIASQDTFSAVTSFAGLGDLYRIMKHKEPHDEPDEITSAATKKRVCQSIAKSGYFDMLSRIPVNADDVYKDLQGEDEKQRKLTITPNIHYKKVMVDYEKKMLWGMRYTYRTRLITLTIGSTKEEEFAFACLVRHRGTRKLLIYYVSDPYDINKALDYPTEKRINARFVCRTVYISCELDSIAEEPAVAFLNLEYSVEDIYLRMRTFYDLAQDVSEDPVCGLGHNEKLRICASVLSSSYFVDKIKFFPDTQSFQGLCVLQMFSFQTDNARRVAGDRRFTEWMLPCPAKPISLYGSSVYFVSRAYHTHHAFVYSLDYLANEIFIENISGRISVIIEKDLKVRNECREFCPPDLVDELNDPKNSREKETWEMAEGDEASPETSSRS